MQPADDVQFRNSQLQRLARFLDDLLDGELETVGITFFPRKRAELAAQNTVIRIIDVTIENVTGMVPDFALAPAMGHCAERMEILALEKPQSVRFREALPGGYLVVKIAEFAALSKEMHTNTLAGEERLAIPVGAHDRLIVRVSRQKVATRTSRIALRGIQSLGFHLGGFPGCAKVDCGETDLQPAKGEIG